MDCEVPTLGHSKKRVDEVGVQQFENARIIVLLFESENCNIFDYLESVTWSLPI